MSETSKVPDNILGAIRNSEYQACRKPHWVFQAADGGWINLPDPIRADNHLCGYEMPVAPGTRVTAWPRGMRFRSVTFVTVGEDDAGGVEKVRCW